MLRYVKKSNNLLGSIFQNYPVHKNHQLHHNRTSIIPSIQTAASAALLLRGPSASASGRRAPHPARQQNPLQQRAQAHQGGGDANDLHARREARGEHGEQGLLHFRRQVLFDFLCISSTLDLIQPSLRGQSYSFILRRLNVTILRVLRPVRRCKIDLLK